MSTFTVVLATDNGGATGQAMTATTGDLRYCIAQANAAHSATTDAITFDPTVFATPQTITLNFTFGNLIVQDSHPLTITGPTTDTVTVSGGGEVANDGLFDIFSGKLTIAHLDITQAGPTGGVFGGGIQNENAAKLTLNYVTFDHDAADFGGGLYNAGTATLNHCTFNLDHGGNSNNGGSGGGAIFNSGKLTVNTSIFSNDSSATYGGAIDNVSGGQVTLTSCTLSDDNAASGGGALANMGSSTATLTNCTLGNDTSFVGGGIYNAGTVKLTKCTLSNDSASDNQGSDEGGGGIQNDGTATLAMCTLSNDSAFDGGGIANRGTLTVSASTLNNDFASDGGGGINNRGSATLTNCTFSSDSTSHNGGAIASAFGTATTITLINCTLSNSSANNGGGIYTVGIFNLTNTIIAGNFAASTGPDIDGNVSMADHDLVGNAGGSTGIVNGGGNIVGGNGNPVIDARLGPLQNNGGPTKTLALRLDSPAIGHADNSQAPLTDQRGHTRIDTAGENTDIGAYER